MKKNKTLNLGKIKIVNLNVVNGLFGGNSHISCGDRKCAEEITQTNTGTRMLNVCNNESNLVCPITD